MLPPPDPTAATKATLQPKNSPGTAMRKEKYTINPEMTLLVIQNIILTGYTDFEFDY